MTRAEELMLRRYLWAVRHLVRPDESKGEAFTPYVSADMPPMPADFLAGDGGHTVPLLWALTRP